MPTTSDTREAGALPRLDAPPNVAASPAVAARSREREPGGLIVRYGHGERLNHWAIAVAFVFLFLSGLALFHPFFFWASALFGGGALMRFLHPIAGVLLVVLFYPYAARLWGDNRFRPADRAWIRDMFAYVEKRPHAEGAPEIGKYNGGQKLMFWSMVWIIAILAITGIALWQPWFAPRFPPSVRRAAGLVHAVAAFVMFVGIGIHWYAAFWTKGSIRAMTRGTVTHRWARFHHPGWYRQLTKGQGS
jgi:formate dehydrogenase subunit gamma